MLGAVLGVDRGVPASGDMDEVRAVLHGVGGVVSQAGLATVPDVLDLLESGDVCAELLLSRRASLVATRRWQRRQRDLRCRARQPSASILQGALPGRPAVC